jgi:hypothetical protein
MAGLNKTIWAELGIYNKLLWKIVWLWHLKNPRKTEPQELYNELVILYADLVLNHKLNPKDKDFSKVLWRACWGRLYEVIVRANSKVIISIDDIIVSTGKDVFQEIYNRFVVEEIRSLVSTPEGKMVLEFILNEPETLRRASLARKQLEVREERERELCKEDLRYYFLKVKRWRWVAYKSAVSDIEQAMAMVFQGA